jgi:hypothetical protein
VTAEEGREKFCAPSWESNRRPLAYETRMVPQDHCQCTSNVPFVKTQLIFFVTEKCMKYKLVYWGLFHPENAIRDSQTPENVGPDIFSGVVSSSGLPQITIACIFVSSHCELA